MPGLGREVRLIESSNFRYIYNNPTSNDVHLLVPIIGGIDVSTDNTCKSEVEMNRFFEGGARQNQALVEA
jgi:hypothetical protein